jgi:hypothetical protein
VTRRGEGRRRPSVFILIAALIVQDIVAALGMPGASAFGVPAGPNRHVGAAVSEGLPQPPVDDHLLAETDGEDGQGGGVKKMDERTDPVVHGETNHPKNDQYPDEV